MFKSEKQEHNKDPKCEVILNYRLNPKRIKIKKKKMC